MSWARLGHEVAVVGIVRELSDDLRHAWNENADLRGVIDVVQVEGARQDTVQAWESACGRGAEQDAREIHVGTESPLPEPTDGSEAVLVRHASVHGKVCRVAALEDDGLIFFNEDMQR